MDQNASRPPRVVIIGGGFGGLTAAQSLKDAPVEVSLVDRSNHHLFQPLLYQVAMAGLSPADIAVPIRAILSKQKNTTVLLGEVTHIDLKAQRVDMGDESLYCDFLIIAAGAKTSYFGHDDWEAMAPGLKTLDDAVEIRRRVLMAFEQAEREPNEERRRALLTFVVIGGGPTGVELAGSLAELSMRVLARDFRFINPASARVILVEAGPRVLPTFQDDLPEKGEAQLRELHVEVMKQKKVTKIDEHGVYVEGELIPSATVIWAAGVRPSPLAKTLGVPLDKGGRIVVDKDLSIPGYPNAFAIGDIAHAEQDGKPLPGVSPVAMQEARAVTDSIVRTLKGEPREPFRYFDKGTMATIGRSRAVAESGKLRLTGFLAWLAWLVVHIWFLIGFRNRFIVMINWAWSYLTYKSGARLITGLDDPPRLYGRHAAMKPQAARVDAAPEPRVVPVPPAPPAPPPAGPSA